MKYLKSFIINEKSGDTCDFETFKDIMLELTDNYYEVRFDKATRDDKNISVYQYYECQFKLYKSAAANFECFCEINKLGSVVGDVVGYIDGPKNIEDSLVNGVIYKRVDDYINTIEDFKDKIDNIIKSVSEIKEVFKYIEDYILPRFKHFSNFKKCSVGLDVYNGTFIITFDTDKYEY